MARFKRIAESSANNPPVPSYSISIEKITCGHGRFRCARYTHPTRWLVESAAYWWSYVRVHAIASTRTHEDDISKYNEAEGDSILQRFVEPENTTMSHQRRYNKADFSLFKSCICTRFWPVSSSFTKIFGLARMGSLTIGSCTLLRRKSVIVLIYWIRNKATITLLQDQSPISRCCENTHILSLLQACHTFGGYAQPTHNHQLCRCPR